MTAISLSLSSFFPPFLIVEAKGGTQRKGQKEGSSLPAVAARRRRLDPPPPSRICCICLSFPSCERERLLPYKKRGRRGIVGRACRYRPARGKRKRGKRETERYIRKGRRKEAKRPRILERRRPQLMLSVLKTEAVAAAAAAASTPLIAQLLCRHTQYSSSISRHNPVVVLAPLSYF